MKPLKTPLMQEAIRHQGKSKKEWLMTEMIRQRERGCTQAEITESLIAAGYSHQEIKDMENSITEGEPKPAKAKMHISTIIIACIFGAFILVRAGQLFSKGSYIWGITTIAVAALSLISIILKRKADK